MRKSIISLILAGSFIVGAAWAEDNLQLQDKVPDRYVVVKGDTLWDISARFLTQPWRWPEIWQLNKEEIKNPHWISPGDVIVLDRSGAQPALKLLRNETFNSAGGVDRLSPRVRELPLDGTGAVSSISPSAIDPYLKRPLVIDEDTFNKAPRIAASYDPRLMYGPGDTVYATNLKAKKGEIWQAFREGKHLIDPETKAVIGYEVQYLGDVRVDVVADVSTVKVISAKEELAVGNRLIRAADKTVINYVPRLPAKAVTGKVISVYGTVPGADAGTYATVVVNRGADDGLEVGSVLFTHKKGVAVKKELKTDPDLMTPSVKIANLFIYRVFPKIAYGLVLDGVMPVAVGDDVKAEPQVERK